jgi:hypothetical protein
MHTQNDAVELRKKVALIVNRKKRISILDHLRSGGSIEKASEMIRIALNDQGKLVRTVEMDLALMFSPPETPAEEPFDCLSKKPVIEAVYDGDFQPNGLFR